MDEKAYKPRESFDQQLADLRNNIIYMGSLTENAIAQALRALERQDQHLANQVITGDEQINKRRYEIEEFCTTLLATQQPTARDLRSVIAAIHIVNELERMADYAAGIARLAICLADKPHLKPLIDLPRMAKIDQEMINASLEAYLQRQPELAYDIAKRDEEIDSLYDQVYRELLTYMLQDPKTITRATHLLWVAHNLERIADRVTNICERVIFMTTAKFEELN